MKSLLLTLLLSVVALPVLAEQSPRVLPTDKRMKQVVYQANNVYPLVGQYGYSTHLLFDENEKILKVDIGDASAWVITEADNHLFVKPVLESKTNMTVITDKRDYQFTLQNTQGGKVPTYQLQFRYPEVEQAKQKQAKARHSQFKAVDPRKLNWAYSFKPKKYRELAPIQAFDNGEFTYFKFRQDKPLPALFSVGPDKRESLVNYTVEGDYLVVHQISQHYRFRLGRRAITIFNEGKHAA